VNRSAYIQGKPRVKARWGKSCFYCGFEQNSDKPTDGKTWVCIDCRQRMRGERVLKHPDKEMVDTLLAAGCSDNEVSYRINRRHRSGYYHLTGIELEAYRRKFYEQV